MSFSSISPFSLRRPPRTKKVDQIASQRAPRPPQKAPQSSPGPPKGAPGAPQETPKTTLGAFHADLGLSRVPLGVLSGVSGLIFEPPRPTLLLFLGCFGASDWYLFSSGPRVQDLESRVQRSGSGREGYTEAWPQGIEESRNQGPGGMCVAL